MVLNERRSVAPEINVGAFSDIAFLLIIFFILATTLVQISGVITEIPSGQQAETQQEEEEETPTVRLEGDRVLLGEKHVDMNELRRRLTMMKLNQKTGDGKVVLLEASGDVTYQNYFDVMASMGDIAFLLIIFFMVCSRFAKDPGVSIQPPTTVEVSKLDDYPIVVLIDEKARIYFQGKPIDSAEQVEEEVRRFVEGKADEKARTVLFRCDRSVGKRIFEPVIEAIAKGLRLRWSPKAGPGTGEFKLEVGAAGWPRPCSSVRWSGDLRQAACGCW